MYFNQTTDILQKKYTYIFKKNVISNEWMFKSWMVFYIRRFFHNFTFYSAEPKAPSFNDFMLCI